MSNLNFSCEGTLAFTCLNVGEALVTVTTTLTLTVFIILGNSLVVLTVYLDDKLRSQRQNWLIVSLAVADLLVGLLVMPLTLLYEVLGEWTLGVILCEIWLALDVLFVTASILHICAISLDRYFSVTQPLSYPGQRTPKRMWAMIGISWLVSLLISLPPIFGWRPENRGSEHCELSKEPSYVIYSSLGSFYIPVIILVCVYAKIYSITIQHSRNRLRVTERLDKTLKLNAKALDSSGRQSVELEVVDEHSDTPDFHSFKKKSAILHLCWQLRKMSSSGSPKMKKMASNVSRPTGSEYSSCLKQDHSTVDLGGQTAEKRRRKLKARERTATLLLGLILSAFIFSWLPFFVMYMLGAFGVESPELIFKFFFWLGYCNSGINPVIYTVFNREFKRALFGQLRRVSRFIRPIFSR